MPKLVDHDAMRAALLDAAAALFAARGYAATGMRDLAEAARVSTGTLYHYFADKRTLFEHLVERTVARDVAELAAVLDAQPAEPLPRLEAFLALVQRDEADLQQQAAVLVEYARLHREEGGQALAPLREAHRRYAAALGRLLGVSSDRANLLLHAVSGLLLQRFTDGNATPFAPVVRQLRTLFTHPERRAHQ
ncbi:MAG: TetR/AcrR family transcriptional regulator [Gemmatimonas sp.]|jgi:AcrR family transcriptional regulator|uniref:TetR/AcrR family transcriptional regulator n=1 Tax=Gemmatimonas sp. TaxID=1962908 RepID=UPI00391F6903|nr:TetR/AcrR family transcriptional regulator; helix-turn-helix transcriptional regulator [Gemmatimonadota bacterium]